MRGTHFLRLQAVCLAILSAAVSAPGIQPHEILLLVNESSPDSMAIANHYRYLRGVPDRNVLYVSLPAKVLEAEAELSVGEFKRLIWEPATEALQSRRLVEHVFVWIYSAGFPVRITSKPPVSLQGITFTRSVLPSPKEISSGRYFSPLFTGPSEPGGPKKNTISLARMADTPFEDRPIPSMMLAFTGSRGNTLDDSIQRIRKGIAADGTFPTGKFFFVQNDNIRSKARDWAFEESVNALVARGFQAPIVSSMPKREDDILGLMIGKPHVNGLRQNTYLPGSMVEHLTSHAANFHLRSQTKCTRWLEAGVSATCGTVTEPRAVWTKFPHPRFYVHYTGGTHIIESFFQSVCSPMQLLILGDPLLSPWRIRPALRIQPIEGADTDNEVRFRVESNHRTPFTRFSGMLDGLFIERDSKENVFTIPLKTVAEGNHELRIIQNESKSIGTVTTQIAHFGVRQASRRIILTRSVSGKEAPNHRPILLETLSEEPGETMAILQGFRLLEERPWNKAASWEINPHKIGAGPVMLQAAVRYPDGNVVRSEPLQLEIVFPKEGPPLDLESRRSKSGDGVSIHAPTLPRAELEWMEIIPLDRIASGNEAAGPKQWNQGRLSFESEDRVASLLLTPKKNSAPPSCVSARLLSTPMQVKGGVRMLSGILFNYRNPQGFDFFALSADRSEWILGEYGNGVVNKIRTRGARIKFRETYELTVRVGTERALEAWVNGRMVLQTETMKFRKGGAGLVLGHGTLLCERFAITPLGNDSAYQLESNALLIHDPSTAKGTEFIVSARKQEAITRIGIRLTGKADPAFVPINLASKAQVRK